MATRTITGNLAADPELVKAGSVSITKLRVIENTGEYRGGKFVARGSSWARKRPHPCTKETR